MKKSLTLLASLMAVTTLTVVGCKPKKTNSSSTVGSTESSSVASSSPKETPVGVEANGAFSYTTLSYDEKTDILGALEKYAVENHLTGVTIFNDGAYQMFNTRVVRGTQTYIPGYGFGTLAEGRILTPLAAEKTEAYKMYYHSSQTDDPATVNYMDSSTSTVGDLSALFQGSYWDVRMNETKDGYEWVNSLANSKPKALNLANGMATKFEFEVKVGSQLKYNTLTKDTALKVYAGREVALEDYLTPYKELHNQKNGLERAAENLNGIGSIKGMDNYYKATANGFSQDAWDKVGLKAETRDGKAIITVEFSIPLTPFYAMYYMSSSLYAPVPASFVEAIGGMEKWGTFDGDRTPVDTSLSTFAYVLEYWERDKQIVYKRNPLITTEVGSYNIAGIHYTMIPAQKTDSEAVFKEFLVGKLDITGIPSTQADYRNDPRAVTTIGSTNWKINVNACTPERWEELFGENGEIVQTSKANYWNVKPIMSNDNFLKGISYAIDRAQLAKNLGRAASGDYFAPNYLSNPEEGIIYSETQQHADAVAGLREEGSDEYGYSEQLAKYYFKKACEELIAAGKYTTGAKITLELQWQATSQFVPYGLIKQNIMDAFNGCGGGLELTLEDFAPTVWSMTYDNMEAGQFDLCFGSVSGDPLNPLAFMEHIKAGTKKGFTMNWGVDTSKADESLVYDGKYWSFDALWTAANEGAYVQKSELVPVYGVSAVGQVDNVDGSRTYTFDVTAINVGDDIKVELVDVVLFYLSDLTAGSDYDEYVLEFEFNEDGQLVVTVPAEQVVIADGHTLSGFDFYFDVEFFGISSEQYVSVY